MKLAEIWRYPIKSFSREALKRVAVNAGEMLPFDRHWAIAHERSKFDANNPQWMPCANFLRGAIHPQSVMVNSKFDEARGYITLQLGGENHQFDPAKPEDRAAIIALVNKMEPPIPASDLVSSKPRGMSDTDYPSISLLNFASLAALSSQAGQEISHHRWRGNLWIDDAEPWAEFDWVGQEITIGDIVFEVIEPIKRCKMTTTNPQTGIRDLDTLALLRTHHGHQNFGVYLRAKSAGGIATGNRVALR